MTEALATGLFPSSDGRTPVAACDFEAPTTTAVWASPAVGATGSTSRPVRATAFSNQEAPLLRAASKQRFSSSCWAVGTAQILESALDWRKREGSGKISERAGGYRPQARIEAGRRR